MKSLVHLTVDGLKSLAQVDDDVPRLLAIAGPNGSGKTARLEAIRLAVLGYEPAVGKRLQDTRQLAAPGGEIHVGLNFNDGFAIRRTFGASTTTELAPPKGETIEADRQERIDEETGAFVPSFDLHAFLELSAQKRRAMLFGLLPRDALSLNQDRFREWLGHAEAEAPIQRAIDRLWIDHVLKGETPADGLASAIEFTRKHFNQAEQDRLAQVAVAMAAAADAENATEAVRDRPQGDREAIQTELAVIQERIGELREQAAAAARAEAAHRNRAAAIQAARTGVGTAEAALERARAAAGDAPTPSGSADVLQDAAATARNRVDAQRDAVSWAKEKLSQARETIHGLHQQLQAVEDAEACPVCGGEGSLESYRAALHRRVTEARAAVEERESALAAVQAEQDAFQAQLQEAVAALRAFEHARQAHAEAAQAVERAEAQLADARERLAAIEALEEVDAPAPPNATTIQKAAARAQELRAQLDAFAAADRAEGYAEAERNRASREAEELERRAVRREGLRALLTALQKLRSNVIEELVGPVEEQANAILQAIDPAKRFRFVFEREGRDEFDFGFEEDGVFRSYDAASTGEDAFLAVVLVAGLIAAVAPTWPVLLVDNAESVDARRRRSLMEALARPEIRDRFGNVILAGCCDFELVDGWTVQALAEDEALEAAA